MQVKHLNNATENPEVETLVIKAEQEIIDAGYLEQRQMSEWYPLFYITIDDKPIAFLTYTLNKEPKNEGWIILAYVEEKHRGKGYFKDILYYYFKKELEKQNIKHAYVGVNVRNVWAKTVYYSMGFKPEYEVLKLK